MKKRVFGTALLTLGLLAGCSKDYLELQPRNAASTETFYTNETDAIQATTSAYSQLNKQGMFNGSLWAIDIMSDNSVTGGGGASDGIQFQQVDNFLIPPTNAVVTNLFQRAYVGIGAANQVLFNVPGISMNETIKKRCLGEAQFLRALYYFYLVRTFGDVPLVLVPAKSAAEASSVTRSPAADVYTQIEKDLLDAIENLKGLAPYTGNDVGRVTEWAARALLAKVYLTEGKKSEAAVLARTVIDGSGKSLWANYGDNFKLENENGRESLFEVQFKSGLNGFTQDGPGSAINEYWGARFFGDPYVVSGGGFGQNIPEKEFVDGYEPGDTRKAVTVFVPGDRYPPDPKNPAGQVQPASLQGSPFGFNVRKFFVGTLPNGLDSPLNVPVLRLAEVYLILAESVGPTAEGLEAINKVRRRAFGLPINTPSARDLTAATPNFEAAVLRERRYELAFEMDRWYDLKRTNTLLTNPNLVAKGIKPINVVLPIPQAEIDVNPRLIQNTGY
ncbi:RagB/SusD family nutrient uptake outer membrane protein [Hymenobacter terrenus]|uniref:RagB/SusD family nutrient uptake outer membrane protein n=1 Tax=Hymenobacter terrenus TaxID=1629124 RepID=UPI000619BE90|nr:RagB/SusD family nutrient uptake outer membrane protein [Hymenobacter terrenus]